MDRMPVRISKKKITASAIAAIYLTAVVLSHKEVSRIFEWLSEALTFEVYDGLILAVCLLSMTVIAPFTALKIIKGEDRVRKSLWFSFSLALIILAYKTLIVFSVESIHFIQYALLALPVYVVAGRLGDTVFWVTLCGALDEAFQYFVLYSWSNEVYFDFNDIVLNLIGAGLGAVLILVFYGDRQAGEMAEGRSFQKWLFSPAFILMMTIGICGFLLHFAGFLDFSPAADASAAPVVLSRKALPAHFWLHPRLGKTFHILRPFEGMAISTVLIFLYSLMDYRGFLETGH